MTPLKLFLIQVVLILMFILFDKAHNNEHDACGKFITIVGGIVIVSIFGTAIWAIIYYIP